MSENLNLKSCHKKCHKLVVIVKDFTGKYSEVISLHGAVEQFD